MAKNNTKLVELPKTFAAINFEFSGKSNAALRSELKASAVLGSVSTRGKYAFTGCGEASIDEVATVLSAEWRELGYAGYHVGPIDSYRGAPVVVFLDQPLA